MSFNESTSTYQEALTISGYDYELNKKKAPQQQHLKKKKRKIIIV